MPISSYSLISIFYTFHFFLGNNSCVPPEHSFKYIAALQNTIGLGGKNVSYEDETVNIVYLSLNLKLFYRMKIIEIESYCKSF